KKGNDGGEGAGAGGGESGEEAPGQTVTGSRVETRSWSATGVRGGERIPATIDGLDLAQPAQIAPGKQITFTVAPTDATAAGDPVHVEYDMSGVHPIPDR